MTHRAPLWIKPYDPRWPALFAAEREELAALLQPLELRIEHVGSTAVPGLAAKAIVDMMGGCRSLVDFEAKIPALEAAGWAYLPQHEDAFPERRFLAKPRQRPRTFHLHVVLQASEFWKRHLFFRDRLRADPVLAQRYASAKYELARRFGSDREGYTEAKTPVIEAILRVRPDSA